MDARLGRILSGITAFVLLGASHRTPNFVVHASNPQFASQVASEAEALRQSLAEAWLGSPLPNWSQPCPIRVVDGPQLGAGGATSFVFNHGEVYDWDMQIQGSRQRILDSVLPHEVTHTIFASHFRQPLPRWADEGACTTVEHESEKAKQQHLLIEFLQTGRGIAFSELFAMRDYPADIMPLYSEGYSLARFLIGKRGRQSYITFLSDGLKSGHWTATIRRHYGYESLASLQDNWLTWVKQGSPDLVPDTPIDDGVQLASAAETRRARPQPNLIYRGQPPSAWSERFSRLLPNWRKSGAADGGSPMQLLGTHPHASNAAPTAEGTDAATLATDSAHAPNRYLPPPPRPPAPPASTDIAPSDKDDSAKGVDSAFSRRTLIEWSAEAASNAPNTADLAPPQSEVPAIPSVRYRPSHHQRHRSPDPPALESSLDASDSGSPRVIYFDAPPQRPQTVLR